MKEAGLPLEKEILPSGLQACKAKKPEVIKGLKKLWAELINPKDDIEQYSFEELLTIIILHEQIPARSKGKELSLLALKLATLEVLVQSLKSSQILPKQHQEFLRIYKDHAYFTTLNYDYMVEKYLIANKIPWQYGVRFDESDLSVKNSYVIGENSDFPNVFSYLKLHGSFNWHYCFRCGNTRLTGLKYFGVSGELFSNTDRFTQTCTKCMNKSGQGVMQPLIVPPSAIKYYNSPIFLHLWFEFNRKIEQVEKIIIVGCSIRDDDTMLIQSLFNVNRKNRNLRKIILVNPDESVKDKVEKYAGITVHRYRTLEKFLLAHS